MPPQVSFISLNCILTQAAVKQPLLLFLAFNNAQPTMVLVAGHGGTSPVAVGALAFVWPGYGN